MEGDSRILAAYLLGSAAQNRMNGASDRDIALLLTQGQEMTPLDLWKVATPWSILVGRTVDLGVLSSHNLSYVHQAIFWGQRIFVRDATEADSRLAILLGLYAPFPFERQEVLLAYGTR